MKWIMESCKMIALSIKSGFQIAWGIFKLSRLCEPIVAIFGGTHAFEEGKYARWAEDAATLCVEQKMAIITGGGPGVMEAAARGAMNAGHKKKCWALGIGVQDVDPGFKYSYGPKITVGYFFVRKWLLTRYTSGFILFPGGIGTADEFFEVLNLMKLSKMKQVPIVLVGTEFWADLVSWYHHAYEKKLISHPPDQAFTVTDSPEEAVKIIVDFRKSQTS